MDERKSEVTRLLLAWSDGDKKALDRLLPLVETELHKIAEREMARERPDHTLQPTALVNEAYLRLVQPNSVNWKSRAHFFGSAALAMKRILVEHARKRRTKKRNEGVKPVPLHELTDLVERRDRELIALDDALLSLSKLKPRQSRAVELRYFANLTDQEIGEILNVSDTTAKRDLRAGRAWLRREIRSAEVPSEEPQTK